MKKLNLELDLPDWAFVRPATVAVLLDCSLRSVWRNSKIGILPPIIKLSPRISGIQVGKLRAMLNGEE